MNYYDQAPLFEDGYVCSKTVCNHSTPCYPQTGVMGPTGPTGPTGPSGESAGTVLPFFSGAPIALTTTLSNVAGIPVLLGVGSAGTTNTPLLPTIDLYGFDNETVNFACSMPRAGIITSVSAYFSITQVSEPVNDTDLVLRAGVYQANTLNDIFRLIPTSVISLMPAIPRLATLGTVLHGIRGNLAVSITPESRLMLVLWAEGTAAAPVLEIRGYASAGLNIK